MVSRREALMRSATSRRPPRCSLVEGKLQRAVACHLALHLDLAAEDRCKRVGLVAQQCLASCNRGMVRSGRHVARFEGE